LDIEPLSGDTVPELEELIEEGTIEIERLAEGQRIPPIAVPALTAVDGKRCPRFELTDHLLATEVAGVGMEVELVTNSKPSLLAALRTLRWWRDRIFLSRKDW